MTATFPHRAAAIAALTQLELAVAKAKAIAAAYAGDRLPSVDDQLHDCYHESVHSTAVDVVLAWAVEAYEAAGHADGEAYFNPDGDNEPQPLLKIGAIAADFGVDQDVEALIAAAEPPRPAICIGPGFDRPALAE